MKRFLPSRTTFISAAVFFIGTPLLVWAQQSGLVPCGTAIFNGSYNAGYYLQATNCNLCYFAQLIQNIVNFLVMITIPLSVAMFAWAGITYFTAVGNPKKISRAHKIFSSVFIGFGIALSGWVFVQVALQAVTRSDYSPSSFFNLSACEQLNGARPRDTTLGAVLSGNGVVSTVPSAPSDTSGAAITCPTGYTPTSGFCLNDAGDVVDPLVVQSGASASGGPQGTNVPTVITNPDGTQVVMSGGSISWRNNNPGNMIAGAGPYQPIGMNGGFAVFASVDDGFNAIMANLKTPLYQNGNMTIAAALYQWAPPVPGSGNNPAQYAAFVQQQTGIPSGTVINSLSREQLLSVAKAIQAQEGWIAGRTTVR